MIVYPPYLCATSPGAVGAVGAGRRRWVSILDLRYLLLPDEALPGPGSERFRHT
jgi:hypothetical protein